MDIVQKHLRVWTQEGVSGISDIAIEIVLEEMKDYKLPTAVEERTHFDAVKILREELRKRKKRKVAEVNQEHEKKSLDDNEGKQDKGGTQKQNPARDFCYGDLEKSVCSSIVCSVLFFESAGKI
jgi:hypothetical protein